MQWDGVNNSTASTAYWTYPFGDYASSAIISYVTDEELDDSSDDAEGYLDFGEYAKPIASAAANQMIFGASYSWRARHRRDEWPNDYSGYLIGRIAMPTVTPTGTPVPVDTPTPAPTAKPGVTGLVIDATGAILWAVERE